MTNYREILRLHDLGFNNSQIAESTGATRQTVITALQRAESQGITYKTATTLSDRELTRKLFPQGDGSKPAYRMPDYEWVHGELAKPGVTLQLLWFEYCDKCRDSGETPYQLTQFKKYYREYAQQTRATMHLNRKPGELMEVDWAGQTAAIIDDETGEVIDAFVFVAVLPYSGYGYVEAFLNQKQPSWLAAHVNAYEYFGGVTRILVPDNLKTGVTKHTKREIILNRSYYEMAEYYGTAVIPTRIRAPKDKATVEGTVGIISTYILAAVRNQKFFTLAELNYEVDIRLTRNVVEVFCDNNRICSHIRLYGKRDLYSTQDAHMPPNHKEYTQWNGERFRAWAAKIGINTVAVVDALFAGYKVEQQGYRTCMSLLKLSEQFTPERLEAACGIALGYTHRPSYKAIQTILKSGRDKQSDDAGVPPEPSQYGFTRGSDYYKGGHGDAE